MGDSGSVEITDSVIETEGTYSPTVGPTEAGHHGMMAKLQELLHKVQGRETHETLGGAVSQHVEAVAADTDKNLLSAALSHSRPDPEEKFEPKPGDLKEFLQLNEQRMARELNESEENAQIVRKNSRAAVIMGKVANLAKAMRNAVIKIMAVTGV